MFVCFFVLSPALSAQNFQPVIVFFFCVHVLKLNFESIYYKHHISSLNDIMWIVMPVMFFQGQCIASGAILIDIRKKL